MKTLKNLFLTILFTIGLVSTSFATKDTLLVVSTTQVYHVVSGTPNLVTSITVNSGDTLVVQNQSGITADFTLNTTTVTGVCGMCDFQYKTLPTDAPNFILKVTAFSTTYNLITVNVNNITTGISENTNKIEFGAFPNPVTDNLTISAIKELGQVTVTNLNGQEVYSETISEKSTNIDFTLLGKGMYIVQVGETRKKVVK